tara:strand:+ start:427 stop:714 length:288 start_codon:yes stop_codon:yes gene_type:complete
MKLLEVKKSTKTDKKYMAVFENNGRTKTTHFGAKGMDDYTIKGDKEQRERYRARHKKDLETKDPSKAGFLSYYLLWGDSTSFAQNLRDFKTRFGL